MNRYILITGCDSGFGNMLAKRLNSLGVPVFAGCLTEKGEDELRKSCSPLLKTFRLDVSDPSSVRKAFDFVKANLPKGQGLWGLMNNAGILGRAGRVEWNTLDDYKHVNSVNSYGLIDMTVTFLPLIKQAKGRIVNTASVVARFAYPASVPYTVSKYMVEGFSDCLRRQLNQFGVTTVIIEPGFHNTPITSLEAVNPMLRSFWESLTPEIRDEFGEEYYRESGRIYEKFHARISDRPMDVVDAYEEALLALMPRARYLIGADANYFWLPLQMLPERLGDWILEYLAKPPIPASMKRR